MAKSSWALPQESWFSASCLRKSEHRARQAGLLGFSFGNYEPASFLFRVQALPGNKYAMTDFEDVASMEAGDYQVQSEDLPAYQIYQCSEDWTKLCIRPLATGELNDRLGVHPENER